MDGQGHPADYWPYTCLSRGEAQRPSSITGQNFMTEFFPHEDPIQRSFHIISLMHDAL